jgi:N-acetylated-alpha-linked acidic dipeptidase
MGNHRDAWVLGAIDPTSGTAAMLEISRALNELKLNKNWKPKRSIIFLSWGAEEFGLIGSTEWVEVKTTFYFVL